jgi:hypothetical protein
MENNMKHFLHIMMMAAVVFFSAGSNVHAQAQNDDNYDWSFPEDPPDLNDFSRYDEKSIEQIEKILKDAQLYRTLGSSVKVINSAGNCGQYVNAAKRSRQQIKTLNSEYRGRADDRYYQLKAQYDENNRKALRDYKTCFAEQTQYYQPLVEAKVRSYQAHKIKMDDLAHEYNFPKDMNVHIDYVQRALEYRKNLANDGIVGTVQSTFQRVEYRPGSKHGGWLNVTRGLKLRKHDELRTGPRGLARIQFADHYTKGNAGPSIINVGKNTHIRIEKFVISFDDPPHSNGVIGLIRGSLRAFTKNWGFRSSFSVRTGTSLVGIRGTELAVVYDPDTDKTDVHLDHGDAYVEVGGVQTTLQPHTSVTIQNNRVSPPRPLTNSIWGILVNSTGDQHNETLATAREGGTITLEQGRVNRSQNTTITGAEITPYDEIANLAKIAELQYVSTIVSSLNQAILDYDEAKTLRYMDGFVKSQYTKALKTRSFRDIVDSSGFVVKVKNDCAVCWEETDSNGKNVQYCDVKAKLYFANGKPRQTVLFHGVKKWGRGVTKPYFKLTNFYEYNGDKATQFEAKNPVCNLTEEVIRRQ